MSRLEGIEEALGSRVALDNENRRAKQFWIACHNLIDTLKHGNKAGNNIDERRLPLNESLNLLKEVRFSGSVGLEIYGGRLVYLEYRTILEIFIWTISSLTCSQVLEWFSD